jgi:hypothetical protein
MENGRQGRRMGCDCQGRQAGGPTSRAKRRRSGGRAGAAPRPPPAHQMRGGGGLIMITRADFFRVGVGLHRKMLLTLLWFLVKIRFDVKVCAAYNFGDFALHKCSCGMELFLRQSVFLPVKNGGTLEDRFYGDWARKYA